MFYVYPFMHFFIYVAMLRRLRSFSQERTIFLYHALSALALGLLIFLMMRLPFDQRFRIAVGALSFHGIYSLSFLELWWLSDGGYSLRILDRIGRADAQGLMKDSPDFEQLGNAKKRDRLESLGQLGLLTYRDGKYELTFFGQCFVRFLYLIQWPSNILKID